MMPPRDGPGEGMENDVEKGLGEGAGGLHSAPSEASEAPARALEGEVGEEEVPYWVEVMVHWLTGLAFALLLGVFLILVAPLAPGLSPILRLVEDQGVDLAMRLKASALPSTTPALPLHYVFLDIDEPACSRLGLGSRCRMRSPADPEVVADMAAAVLSAGPAVLVIDADLWDYGPAELEPKAAFARLALAAQKSPRTPIVAAGPYRPGAAPGTALFETDLAPQGLRGVPIHYAPSFLFPIPGAQDDVIRSYSPTVSVAEPGQAGRTTPTLPMLSALYAAAMANGRQTSAVDCRFPSTIAPPAPCAAPKGAAAASWPMTDPALSLKPEARLIFAFRSASTPGVMSRNGRYERVLASQSVDANGTLLADPSLFSGKIVVISTSDAHALDIHTTPLGAMAGAEIVVNAIDALANHAWIYPPSPLSRLGHEAEIAMISSLPFLAFWLSVFALQRAPWVSPWKAPLVHCAGFFGFFLAIGFAMLASGVVTVASLSSGDGDGFTTEFFTPIFALSLEGFAEGASWLLGRIERVAEGALRRLHQRLGRSG